MRGDEYIDSANRILMPTVIILMVCGLPFLLGMLLGSFLGSGGSYAGGYCAALNSEVLPTGKGSQPVCIDPQGRITKIQ